MSHSLQWSQNNDRGKLLSGASISMSIRSLCANEDGLKHKHKHYCKNIKTFRLLRTLMLISRPSSVAHKLLMF